LEQLDLGLIETSPLRDHALHTEILRSHSKGASSMNKHLHILSLAVGATALLALGGCATQEEVKHAQSTADTALSTAQGAQQAAGQAQQTASQALGAAQTAQQSADRANTAVGALDQKVNGIQSDVNSLKEQKVARRGPRG
jgi:hypothetical protein